MVTVDNDGSYLVKLPNHEPIKVTLDELYGQVNKKGERKNAVESELGIKAIERAYARYLKENENYEAPTMFGIIDEGDYLRTPLFNLTRVYPQTIKINKSNIDSLLQNIAYTGGTNCHVVTCSTPKKGKYGDYVDYQRRFIENHAYSIKRINPTDRIVEIVNPHNTKYYYALNFDEFSEYFTEICDLKL